LTVSTAQRSSVVPDLPSINEAGIPDFDLNSWNGFFAPVGTDAAIVAKLNAAINQIVRNPVTRQQLAALGFDAFSGTPENFAAFVSEQRDL
jgi:tripartite-type tricarboxylate transporter receptor subunit TctC